MNILQERCGVAAHVYLTCMVRSQDNKHKKDAECDSEIDAKRGSHAIQ